jgi:hypothetical protein
MKTPQTLRPAMPNETPLSPAEISHGVINGIITVPAKHTQWPEILKAIDLHVKACRL